MTQKFEKAAMTALAERQMAQLALTKAYSKPPAKAALRGRGAMGAD